MKRLGGNKKRQFRALDETAESEKQHVEHVLKKISVTRPIIGDHLDNGRGLTSKEKERERNSLLFFYVQLD